MVNKKQFNVDIYYTADEANEAFNQEFNSLSESTKVHIFTKNLENLKNVPSNKNIEVHSTGSLWNRLKAWIAGEEQFQQQFSLLNITSDERERYRTIILNGGTIVLTSANPAIDKIFSSPEETYYANAANEELNVNIDPDLNSTAQAEEKKENDDAKDSLNAGSPIADAKMDTVETLDTNRKSFPREPEEALDQPGDIMAHLNTYEKLREESPDSPHQLENLEQSQQEHHATMDHYQTASTDEFNIDGLLTDSTESVLDEEIVANLVENESALENDEDPGNLYSKEIANNYLRDEIIGKASEYRRHDTP